MYLPQGHYMHKFNRCQCCCYPSLLLIALFIFTLIYQLPVECGPQATTDQAISVETHESSQAHLPSSLAGAEQQVLPSADANTSNNTATSLAGGPTDDINSQPDPYWKVKGQASSKPPDGSCDTMIMPLCNQVGWNTTIKPFRNHLNHTTQEQANGELNKYGALFGKGSKCEGIDLFLCTLYAPQCTIVAPKILEPCQHVCFTVLHHCNYLLEIFFKKSRPDIWNCNRFPTPSQDPTCVGDHRKANVTEFSDLYQPLVKVNIGLPSDTSASYSSLPQDNTQEETSCKRDQFDCRDPQRIICIDPKFVCDKTPECPNNLDEANCTRENHYLNNNNCGPNEFSCERECIQRSKLCDGKIDCSDASDEQPSRCLIIDPQLQSSFDYTVLMYVIMIAAIVFLVLMVILCSCKKGAGNKKGNFSMELNVGAGEYEATYSEPSPADAAIWHPLPQSSDGPTYDRIMSGTTSGASSVYGYGTYHAPSIPDEPDLRMMRPAPLLSSHRRVILPVPQQSYGRSDTPPAPPPPPPSPETTPVESHISTRTGIEYTL